MATDRINKIDRDTRSAVASAGGAGRAAALSGEERSAISRSGAAAINSPAGLALRLRRKWTGIPLSERKIIAAQLAGCRGLAALMGKAEPIVEPPA
jgi:acyl-CoA reductase-like NAD-dependent aldehyde dehydrogenase